MTFASPKPCGHPGCGALVRDGSGRCEKHQLQAWAKRPNARRRVTGRRLQADRRRLFSGEPLCRACHSVGRVTLATERDHIVPLSEGGADEPSNIQPLCGECHKEKTLAEALRARRKASRIGG